MASTTTPESTPFATLQLEVQMLMRCLKCAARPPGKPALMTTMPLISSYVGGNITNVPRVPPRGTQCGEQRRLRTQGPTECGGRHAVVCPAGKINSGKHDASENDTLCGAQPFGTTVRWSHAGTACPAGQTSSGKPRTLVSTPFSDATTCGENQNVVNRYVQHARPGNQPWRPRCLWDRNLAGSNFLRHN